MQNIFPPRQNLYKPEFAETLKLALPELWDGSQATDSDEKNLFICGAIASVKADTDLLRLIQQRLEGYATLTAYTKRLLQSRGKDARSLTRKVSQANRRAWMLDMIEEFSTDTGETT